MIHEVLMALCGYPGNFLIKIMESKFLSRHEKMLLSRILKVAAGYKTLQDFIGTSSLNEAEESYDNQILPDFQRPAHGLYLQAFRDGLNEVLEPYASEIAELEAKALEDFNLPLTLVASTAEKYANLFEVLNGMIIKIKEQRIHGCQLLVFLHRELAAGMDEVKESIKCIIHSCQIVFFKQLSSWLLYGSLVDGYNEFFIQRMSEVSSLEQSVDSLISQDSSGRGSPDCRRQSQEKAASKFYICYDMLPSYILPSLASKILFTGQTILMFGTDPKEKSENMFLTPIMTTSIWGEREMEFFHKFQKLIAMKVFNLAEFEATIDEIRTCVTEHLWKLAVEDADLFSQLKLMKDFYLLGRGELFLEFIRLVGPILVLQNPTTASMKDVNQAFRTAARTILMNDDAVDKFSFILTNKSVAVGEDVKGNWWQYLTLTYKVSWPLHLLFDSEVLEDYNRLFQFLLRVRKTQMDLHNVWINHMEFKNKSFSQSAPAIWELRNRLMFLIDNLQYYLQVDVLESQFMLMQSKIQATRDFEDIQKAHSLFQRNVMSQTFLLLRSSTEESELGDSNLQEGDNNPVNTALSKVLTLCEQFCVRAHMWQGCVSLAELPMLDEMVTEYECLMTLLLVLLGSMRSHACGSHLSQLLLRLDFNRWFSKQNNMVVAPNQV